MSAGLETVRNWVGAISSLAIIMSIIAYLLSRKQFQFTVMIKCIDRFQTLLPDLESLDQKEALESDRIIRQYIDLCEEELFYFKEGYLPKKIRTDWIEGMLNYLPLYDSKNILLNEDYKLKEIDKRSLLDGYPRIHRCFGYKQPNRKSATTTSITLVEKRL